MRAAAVGCSAQFALFPWFLIGGSIRKKPAPFSQVSSSALWQRPLAEDRTYSLTNTLKIGGAGGWDYVTVDPQSHLVYVTRSSHTQVIDPAAGKVVGDIGQQSRSHGVVIVPDAGRGFITDGGAGAVLIFDLKTNDILGKLDAPKDADGAIYDPGSKRVLCVAGDSNSVFTIDPNVDPKNGKIDPPLDLGGSPEFLAADGQGKAYINLVNKDEIAVVDTKSMKLLSKWPVAPGGSPVGMAMDTANRRLFIGCRKPPKMIVMSADDGKILADLPIGQGVDATKFDDGDAFASCRDGTMTVVRETSPGKFEVVQTVSTKSGARTMGVDESTHTAYLPTADMVPPANGSGRPTPKPDSFVMLVVTRGK